MADTYAALYGEATRPCAEAIAMNRPESESASAGQAARASRKGLVSINATIHISGPAPGEFTASESGA